MIDFLEDLFKLSYPKFIRNGYIMMPPSKKEEQIMKSYYKLHRDIFSYGLVPHDLVVYLYLCCCQNKDTHTCWPSCKTIAKNVNVSQSTVVRTVKNLMERSLIKITPRKQGKRQTSNLYTILELPLVPSDSNRDFATKTTSLGSLRPEGFVTKQEEINKIQ